MEDKFKYYTYTILFLSIVLHSTLFQHFKGILLVVESFIFFIVFLSTIYLMYSLEKKESSEKLLLLLFAFLTINSLIIFLFINGFYPILLATLDLAGLYAILFSIPENKELSLASKTESCDNLNPDYSIGKSDELKKAFEKQKEYDSTHYLPGERRDIHDDLLDESELVIEEIKPIRQLDADKKGKRNKPKNKK